MMECTRFYLHNIENTMFSADFIVEIEKFIDNDIPEQHPFNRQKLIVTIDQTSYGKLN